MEDKVQEKEVRLSVGKRVVRLLSNRFALLFVVVLLAGSLFVTTNARATTLPPAPAPAATLATEIAGGDITQNTTWTAAGSPYILNGSVTVKDGVTLAIEPGVVVQESFEGHRIDVEGHLEAIGTADAPITFTSGKDTQRGQWGGIHFLGGTGHLKHTTVRYAGGYNRPVYIQNIKAGGEVRIEESLMEDNYNYPISIETQALPQVVLSGNTFRRNSDGDTVHILGGTLYDNATFPLQHGDGYSCDKLTVDVNATLTISPGVTLRGCDMDIAGHLEAVGTSTQPITFTSAADTQQGQWNGIGFIGGTGHLKHTTVRYGGGNRPVYIKNIKAGGEVRIEESIIEDNSQYPIIMETQALPQVVLSGNTFRRNSNGNTVHIFAGTLYDNATLTPQYGDGYSCDGITIDPKAKLTIEPGVTMRSCNMSVEGHLDALGTATQPITFTSVQETAPGEWRGIGIAGGTMHLKHTTLRYGGYGGMVVSVKSVKEGGEVLIENSRILQSSGYGIQLVSGKLTLKSVILERNGGDGIQVNSGGEPAPVFSIEGSEFSQNGNGIRNSSSVQLDARNTWWGDASGPGGDGPGKGDGVIGDILYDPWLKVPPISEPPATPTPIPTPTVTVTPVPTTTVTVTPVPTTTVTVTPVPTTTVTPEPTVTVVPTTTPIPGESPIITLNHTNGKPGSKFVLSGAKFGTITNVAIAINGKNVTSTSIMSDSMAIVLMTNAAAKAGIYRITITTASSSLAADDPLASVEYTLDEAAPLREDQPEGATAVDVPVSVEPEFSFRFLYLPLVVR